jgi:hypothetical protein
MGAKEDFSSSLQLETSESIRSELLEAKKPVSLYKKAVEVLGKMERNFDNALGNNAYDYFDGDVETDLDKTEFEKKAQELSQKAEKLYEQMSIGSALYVWAQSKLEISSVEQQELDSLVQVLLQTQEKAKQQVESDLADGKLDEDSHIAPDFVDYNESEKQGEPIIEVQTQGDHQFRFSRLEDYNPPTNPQKIQITDPRVKAMVTEVRTYGGADNIDETNPKQFEKWVEIYLLKTPDLSEKYGVGDYRRLTPKQAIQIASEITTRHIDYDYEQITFLGVFTHGIFDNDNDSVSELLKEGAGVCRNYAHAVKVIFDSLKALQIPDSSKLVNTYANLSTDIDSNDPWDISIKPIGKILDSSQGAGRREIVEQHMWNTFYTVSPSGEVQGLVVDATWADKKGKEMKNPDYTDSRFLFNLERMVIEGLLTQEQKITQLEKWCQNTENLDSKSYKVCTHEIGDYYLRQGNKAKGLDWYMKVPSLKSLLRIQDDYDIPKQTLHSKIQELDPNNIQNASFFAKYSYQKGNFKKTIEFGLKSLNEKMNNDIGILVCVSCIKTGSSDYKGYTPEWMCKNVKDWMEENYPKEAKIIIAKYENKTADEEQPIMGA